MFGVDTAVVVYQESDRQSQNSSVKLASRGVTHDDRIVHVETLVELADGFRTIVHGNANNLQALSTILILQFHKVRDLFPAGGTPGCPEVQENQLAPVVGKMKLLSVQLGKGEVRSERVLGGFGRSAGPPVMTGDEVKSRDDGDRRNADQNFSPESRAQSLLSLGNWIALIHPIGAKIVGDIEHLDVGEAHGAQRVVGRLDVWTMAPGATATVNNDEFVSG